MDLTVVIAIAVAMWLALALHTGLSMRRYGRRWWVWFLISAFFSVIPATIMSYVEYFRALDRQRGRSAGGQGGRGGQPAGRRRRCEHCGELIGPDDLIRRGGAALCPRCKLPVSQEDVA